MHVINCRGQHSAGLNTSLSTDSKTYTLLTSVHNDADDADDYNRVIGIAQLKAFSCAKIVLHFYNNSAYHKWAYAVLQ